MHHSQVNNLICFHICTYVSLCAVANRRGIRIERTLADDTACGGGEVGDWGSDGVGGRVN